MEKAKKFRSKFFSYFLIFIFSLYFVSALEECKGTTQVDEIPCLILLEINITPLDCSTYSFSVYNTSTLIYTSAMQDYSPVFCSGIFNQTDVSTYNGKYSTGDTFTIIVEEGNKMILLYYFLAAILILLTFLGIWKQDINVLAISGFGLLAFGVYVVINGFSIYDNLLTKIVSTLFIAFGAYLIGKCMEQWFDF